MSVSELLTDTNAARADNGVAALQLNGKLDAAAQAKANDMAARNYWSHYTPDGNPPWVFVTDQGYSYQKLGENLAAGFSDEQATIDGWMASPPHRENMLDTAFTQVGFGYANNANYTSAGGGPMTIVVAFYGEPSVPAAPANVQGESTPAPSANSTKSGAAPTPAPTTNQPSSTQQSPKTPQPSTSQTAANKQPKSSDTSRLQLALPSASLTSTSVSASVVLAAALILFWISRHMLAIRRYFIKGERYAVRHPLADIGLVVIAALLFILSRTAGVIH